MGLDNIFTFCTCLAEVTVLKTRQCAHIRDAIANQDGWSDDEKRGAAAIARSANMDAGSEENLQKAAITPAYLAGVPSCRFVQSSESFFS